MKKRPWPIVPIAFVLVGLAIGLNPDGRVLQMQFGFGEYRQEAAAAFIIFGVIAFFLLQRRPRDGSR